MSIGMSSFFTPNRMQHIAYMQEALAQAQLAYNMGEIPVGAVVVDPNGNIIGKGHNRTIIDHDPTAHAEVIALRQAAKALDNYRLPRCRVYVTLEPCLMCLGAMMCARISHIVFGATDTKTGACGGVVSMHAESQLNHHTRVSSGVLSQECRHLLRDFFKERRENNGITR